MPVKLFIADRSNLIREWLKGSLKQFGWLEIVGTTGDAGQPVEAVRRLRPHVAILDIEGMNGNGIRELRRIKAELSIPVMIVFADRPGDQYRWRCVEAGADYFFDKATEHAELLRTLKELRRESERSA
jgi:DNA-binding NarL/FixJ family response regulator